MGTKPGCLHIVEEGEKRMLVSCPECGATAEITDRFRLPSTAGPVDHVTVNCVAGHHFRMPADDLTDARHRITI
jgi:predicted  nucleic acid-binding Zn-ribbon protein